MSERFGRIEAAFHQARETTDPAERERRPHRDGVPMSTLDIKYRMYEETSG